MRKIRSWLMLAGSAVVTAALADPFAGYLYPAGMQTGTTVRVVVGGQGLGGVSRGWVSGSGVRIVGVERVPAFTRAPGDGQVKWIGRWLRNLDGGDKTRPPLPKDEDLRNWPRNRWWEHLDQLDALALSIVRRDHYEPRPDPLQAAPAISERLILTIAADGDAAPGLRSVILYDGRAAAAPRPFFVSAEPHVTEPLYAAPPQKREGNRVRKELRPCRAPVVLDGQILPGETDVFQLTLKGGDELQCLLIGRELVPYLGDAVPGFFNPVLRLTDENGKELAFADDFHFLPDPVLSCRIEKTGTYRLEVRDNLYRGRDDFVYSVSCFTDGRGMPTSEERAFVCRPRPPEPPGSFAGVVACPGGRVAFDFEVSEAGERDIELWARRIGSPLDGVVRLYGPESGWWLWRDRPLLATWDDVTNRLHVGGVPQAECDPVGRWRFDRPGDYRLVVEDRAGGGGADYAFKLGVSPCGSAFDVYSLKSSLVLQPWKNAKVDLKVKVERRNGFDGPVRLVGNDDVLVERGEISAGSNSAKVVVCAKRDWQGARLIRLTAVATSADGQRLERPVVPGNEVEQAFAYTHILPETDIVVIRQRQDEHKGRPEWIGMPYDTFLPRRVVWRTVDWTSFGQDRVAAMDALAKADASVLKAPADADDAVLAAKFASSAAAYRRRNGGVFAVPSSGDAAEAARAVLAGCRMMVTPELDFAEGDVCRVRTMARALAQPPDNDVLLHVPQGTGDPLEGPVGNFARRLRDAGWCFDFVSDKTLPNAPLGRSYRAVVVSQAEEQMSEEARELLKEAAAKKRCAVIYAERLSKNVNQKLAKNARRERFPAGLRFARFGRDWGEGWYFVHNPTSERVSGEARLNIRGKVRAAFLMDVRSGVISPLPKTKDGKFALELEAGGSAWICGTR